MTHKLILRLFAAVAVLLSLTGSAFAQKGYDVDLAMSSATVKSFTDALTSQTGIAFSFESALAGKSLGNVSVHGKQLTMASILNEVVVPKGITYSVAGSTYVLSQIKVSSSPLRGRVFDSNGDPLPGAGVLVKGTSKGTVTDLDGRYELAADPSEVLVFSYIGFKDVEVAVVDQTVIDITLHEDQNILDDVVIVGYGTQSRKTLTTAIAKVDGDKIMDAPVSTVGDALKGKVTGLHIISNNNLPGEAPMFLIRGGSSINRSNSPLCLVDGVERSFEDLNPNDIESIEVLKDAASSAIYGSRASNGVILVTTRKGNQFKGPQIVFDAQVGFNSPARTWDLANATEYLSVVRPAAYQGPNSSLVLFGGNGAGVGNTSATATYSTRYLEDGEAVPAGYLSMADPIDPDKTIIYTDKNWQREWYAPAFYHKEYVGINGGNQDMKYAASIGTIRDMGMVAMSGYKNFTMHGNTSFKITKNLEASTTFDFTKNLKNPMTSNYFNALGRGIMMSPTHIGKYEDGSFATGGTNANQQSAEFYEAFYDRENSRQKFMGNIGLKWTITDWLTANAQYAYYDNSYRGSYYAYGTIISDQGGVTNNFMSGTRATSESRSQTCRQNFQAYLSMNKTIGKGKLDGTAGYEYSNWTYYNLSASASGAKNDKLPYIQSGDKGNPAEGTASTFDASNEEYGTALISYFGRLGYNYADRYIVSASFRADGSSLFSDGNRWGYFPSASAAWIISEEPFYGSIKDTMNSLKVRASYGLTGNNDISRTAPLGSYSLDDYAGYATLLPSEMLNSGLRWETTAQFDLGLDFGFFNDRIRLILDYYNKTTNDMIFSITLPDTGQFSSVQANVGSARFYGAELELHTVNIQTRDFSWDTDFTFSFNRNKVISLPEEYAYDIKDMDGNLTGEKGYRIGGYTTATGYRFGGTAVGEPLGRIWGYKVAGVLQNDVEAAAAYYDTQSHGYRRSDGLSITGRKDAGDFEWVNRYGTAKTSDGQEQIDATDMFCLGNVTPHSTGGINNTFHFKRITFQVYMDYALGHSIYNYMKTRMVQNTLGYSNSNLDMTLFGKSWRHPGDDSQMARFFPNDADYGNRNYSRASTYNVEKASYICLRDVSLYYDLPDNWVKKLSMKKLTVGVTGNTLFYFTRLSGAISPETGIATDAGGTGMYTSTQMGASNSNIMPAARKLMFNLKLTF